MLRFYAKQSSGEDFQLLSQPRSSNVWIHGDQVTSGDIDTLVDKLSLDRNILQDVRDIHELPRVERSGTGLYVFLRTSHITNKGHARTAPLLAVVRKDLFVTLAYEDTQIPDSILSTSLPVRTSDSHRLLLTMLAVVVSEYEQLVHHTDRSIQDVKNRLRTHEVGNKDFVQFVSIEDNLNVFQMNLDGLLTITHRLRENRSSTFTTADIEALDDLSLHIQQLLAGVKSYKQTVTSIRNAYSTIASNTLNQRMRVLTIFTVLITLPNVIYGMYGMNVALPIEDEAWAYPVIVGFTLVLALSVFVIAKRFRIF